MELSVYVTFAQRDERRDLAWKFTGHAQRFEAAGAPAPCLQVPYWEATPELMGRLAPQVVVLSGFGRSFEQYHVPDFLPLLSWLDSTTTPVLALCGGHQLLGNHYTQDLRETAQLFDQPIRRLRPGEPVTNPDYHPDHFMERGFYSLNLTEDGASDPLFQGLGEHPQVYESHYCEVKQLPAGFRLLASTEECRIQAMRRDDRLLYSFQFHPEDYSDTFPAGRILLERFFDLAKSR